MNVFDFAKLPPGTVLRYGNSPYLHVLDRRKDDDSGWWLRDNSGGLADRVWGDGDWQVVGVLWTVGAGEVPDPLGGAWLRGGREMTDE